MRCYFRTIIMHYFLGEPYTPWYNGSLNLFGTHLRRCELCHQENNIDGIDGDHVLECYSTIDNLSVKSHFLKL